MANHRLRSDFTISGCGATCYALVPADFQTIYNLKSLYTSGTTGAGQTIAVVEDTNAFGTDWQKFQSKFGLTSFGGTLTTVHPNSAGNCTNPGINSADVEADLDVEMVTASAPGAAVELISCADTTTTFGGLIAIQNIISAGTPPPIMSMSYSVCEVLNGATSIKPGASVLASVTDAQAHTFPALVAQRFGGGRSAALLIGDMWRWGFRDESSHKDMDKSWRQMMRWLVTDVPGRIETHIEPKESSESVTFQSNRR